MIRAACFSLDGTLVDTRQVMYNAYADTIELETGRRPTEGDLDPWITGSPSRLLRHYGVSGLGHYWHQYDRYLSQVELFYEDTEVLVDTLHEAGIEAGIVTSLPGHKAHGILAEVGLDGIFDTVVTWMRAKKPSPRPLLEAFENLDVLPDEGFYVGDLRVDIQAGHNAGCLTGAAMWGYSAPVDLLDESPDYILWHIADVPNLCALVNEGLLPV